ncbi:MAG: Rne/Rng family ribonuclease [Alphaproteobacteria bacterium]
MSKRMLIDATQPDETRVVVLDNGRVEEIDVEISSKKQIKSNIYLARVTRVEPSLQAAFVDYGGNRHGFLPFSEIHPDYYQIPIADREALLQEVADLQSQAGKARDLLDDEDEGGSSKSRNGRASRSSSSRPKRVRKGRSSTEEVAGLGDQPDIDHGAVDASDFGNKSKGKRGSGKDNKRKSTDLAEVAFIPIRPLKDLKNTTTLPVSDELVVALEDGVEFQSSNDIGEMDVIEIEALVEGKGSPDIENDGDLGSSDPDDTPKSMAAMIDGEEDAVLEETSEATADDVVEDVKPEKPKRKPRAKAKKKTEPEADSEASSSVDTEVVASEEETAAKKTPKKRAPRKKAVKKVEAEAEVEVEISADDDAEDQKADETAVEPAGEIEASATADLSDSDQAEIEIDDDSENDTDDDAVEEAEQEHRTIMRNLLARRYKIQEVIKRRQILLVQVSKEERGNKGAALTTYLSLAGRYCVLMPNTARGGGISRKIANVKDRKRLKRIVDDLDMPTGISVIVRTAGSERTKTEIQRDYDYLVRTWDKIRENTLESTAPSLIHEEGDIIKRAIRDIYSSDMEEIVVDGADGYKDAKAFMKMLSPTHSRRVKQHVNEATPLFIQEGIEDELETLHEHIVQLPSGGYIVLNQTEALVAVDVNSGRAIKERHIEDTALKTNLEAADEVARQLRLRDLAGLVVIDFIDMEESRNNSQVERRLRDALRFDRARVQTSKISGFGLLELSRQRIRPSVMEATHINCHNCNGTGLMRSAGALALSILRAIEERLANREFDKLILSVPAEIALALLNDRRSKMNEVEKRLGYSVVVQIDSSLARDAYALHYEDARHGLVEIQEPAKKAQPANNKRPARQNKRENNRQDDNKNKSKPVEADVDGEKDAKPKRNRRRNSKVTDYEQSSDASEETKVVDTVDHDDEDAKKKRKRGKRGGRKRRAGDEAEEAQNADGETAVVSTETNSADVAGEATVDEIPAKGTPTEAIETVVETPELKPEPAPAPVLEPLAAETISEPEETVVEVVVDEKPKKKRVGWWSKK